MSEVSFSPPSPAYRNKKMSLYSQISLAMFLRIPVFKFSTNFNSFSEQEFFNSWTQELNTYFEVCFQICLPGD